MSIVPSSAAITCLLAVWVLAVPSAASEIRRIGQTDATSECIGDPKTALCAVETFLACFGRRDRSLCRAVGVLSDVSFADQDFDIEYELVRTHVLRPSDIPERLKGVEWARPGLTEMLVRDRYCEPDLDRCVSPGWNLTSLTLENSERTWRVISWSGVDSP